jgi:sugar lactone lactonase YvrE
MGFQRKTLVDGIVFGEGPRWHDGRLWFSDMHAQAVMTAGLDGTCKKVIEVPGRPSGLGWLPDGRLLVVSMVDRRLLRLEGDQLVEHANLSNIATWHCNDMVVDGNGNAYVGNFGFDIEVEEPIPVESTMAMVTSGGRVERAADGLLFPNGAVITPDAQTLVVAETYGARLTAFDIQTDGSLTGRRVFADLSPNIPDGICLDSEGAIWVADPDNGECIRVLDGGKVTDRISTGRGCYACMLGGPDRKTLFLMTADDFRREKVLEARSGKIEVIEVEVPGAGLP